MFYPNENRLFSEQGRMYFPTSYRDDEIQVLKQTRPRHLMTSYSSWANMINDKCLEEDLMNKIGYKPDTVIVDSGAFSKSFRTREYGLIEEMLETYKEMVIDDGGTFDVNNDYDIYKFAHWWFYSTLDFEQYKKDKREFYLFEQYMYFLFWNQKHYTYCMSFDKMDNNYESWIAYRVMRALGLPVIPVYQALTKSREGYVLNRDELDILDYYVQHSDYVAIGGTALQAKGYTKKMRVAIVRQILCCYPRTKFHLCGTLDPYVMKHCPELFSVDGQCWVQKVKKEDKVARTIQYVENKLSWLNAKQKSAG